MYIKHLTCNNNEIGKIGPYVVSFIKYFIKYLEAINVTFVTTFVKQLFFLCSISYVLHVLEPNEILLFSGPCLLFCC